MTQTADDLLKSWIAQKEGIRPQDVTLEYTRAQREARFYPGMQYDVDSDPAKFDVQWPKFFTDEQMEDIERTEETKRLELGLL